MKKTERDGWIEFKISNVQLVDAGYYRCGVLGAQTQIYSDYYFEVFGKYFYMNYYNFTMMIAVFFVVLKCSFSLVCKKHLSDQLELQI